MIFWCLVAWGVLWVLWELSWELYVTRRVSRETQGGHPEG